MKILVTGGAGFIASHVADAYVALGHAVVVVDDLSSGRSENVAPAARFERLDVRSADLARLIERERFDVINHHAAQMSVARSVDDPAFDAEVNVLGLLNMLAAAVRAGTRRIVFPSSGGTVYANPDPVPAREEQATVPLSPYGISKLASEHYLQYFGEVRGLHWVALRYANVYGPRQDPHGEAGVIAIFTKRLLADRPVTVFGDGLQTRDYVFVADVVRANVMALTTRYRGVVNIGTGHETSVLELYENVRRLTGTDAPAEHAPERGGEVRRIALDISRARRELGWAPEVGLADGLARTVEFFRGRS